MDLVFVGIFGPPPTETDTIKDPDLITKEGEHFSEIQVRPPIAAEKELYEDNTHDMNLKGSGSVSVITSVGNIESIKKDDIDIISKNTASIHEHVNQNNSSDGLTMIEVLLLHDKTLVFS